MSYRGAPRWTKFSILLEDQISLYLARLVTKEQVFNLRKFSRANLMIPFFPFSLLHAHTHHHLIVYLFLFLFLPSLPHRIPSRWTSWSDGSIIKTFPEWTKRVFPYILFISFLSFPKTFFTPFLQQQYIIISLLFTHLSFFTPRDCFYRIILSSNGFRSIDASWSVAPYRGKRKILS